MFARRLPFFRGPEVRGNEAMPVALELSEKPDAFLGVRFQAVEVLIDRRGSL
jgi:hypothetical protein